MKRRIACCLLGLNFALGCAPVQHQRASPPKPSHEPRQAAGADAKRPARFDRVPEARALDAEPRGARQKSALKDRVPFQGAALEPVVEAQSEPACALPDSTLPHGFYRDDEHTAGQVVLTFDDGPTVNHTPRVLKLLERHGYQATFFLVGKNIRSNTYQLVQRMVEQGHTIGSHSYNHDVEMSFRDYGERTIGYIQGQHEATQMLIELALVATSAEDFREIYERVFGIPEGRYLSGTELRTQWPEWERRHFDLLRERGYPVVSRQDDTARPYPIVYSRPPGGGPYLGAPGRLRKLNDEALRRVGFLNVLWHDASGDTVDGVRNDPVALQGNLRRSVRRGGVALLHGYIRKDALEAFFGQLDAHDDWQVVSLDSYAQAKYGCSPKAVRHALMSARASALPEQG